jgi:hypothetical protein
VEGLEDSPAESASRARDAVACTTYKIARTIIPSTLSKFSQIPFFFYVIMRRIDQGHLHPKLEVPGLTCPGRESKPAVGGEHSRKEPFEQLVTKLFRTST